jgi:iron complex transport system substrate-binding protein
LLHALGLGDSVVGVTHECDYPSAAGAKPHLTRSVIAAGLPAAEIDREVRERTERGEAIYELDSETLGALTPDLIVAQQVCEVCAVSYEDVLSVARTLPSSPRVLSLDPATVGDVLADVRTLARAAGAAEAGEALLADAHERLDRVRAAVAPGERPRVLALEWLDPPFAGGHWVPEMIDRAGGVDVMARPGERSKAFEWADAEAARPDVVVSMPCGYGTDRAAEETRPWLDRLTALGASRVVAVDASSYFSRPGPRLVDGVELLAHVLHPDRVAAPPPGRFVELGVAAPLR